MAVCKGLVLAIRKVWGPVFLRTYIERFGTPCRNDHDANVPLKPCKKPLCAGI
jgi:hypothetical protein